MTDVTSEQAQWAPAGTMQTIAATYAQALLLTGASYHSRRIPASTPLFMGEWAGKTGVSQPVSRITPEWGKTVEVDLVQARAYGEVVFTGMTDFISNADLETKLDLSAVGAGEQTLSWWFSLGVIGHLFVLAGQIAALKGLQGLKGDMF